MSGYSLEKEVIHNYALDRIVSFEECYKEVAIQFDAEERFSDLIGVTYTSTGPMEITFRCSAYLSNYFRTKKIHASQVEVNEQEEGTFSIYCHINRELIAKFLSYGEDLVVLTPDALVDKMKRKVKTMIENYE